VIDPSPALVTAGYGRRLLAALLDSLLAALLWITCAMWLALAVWALRGLPERGLPLIALVWTLLAFGIAVRLVYHVVFVGGCGQTPGAMALGIAVVNRAGAVPGYGRAFARWFGSVVSALTLGLASLPFIFSRDRRGLADRIAGTRVVVRSEP
jgi:uncharacterized RDD family membrane protein YckC